MFSVFVPSETSLKKAAVTDLAALPEGAVWIDLVKPSSAEDKAVERLAGIVVPTREDMQEIEISSRLYIENGARYMTATLMCQSDTDVPRTTAVTFILSGHRLTTVRYDEPKPFAIVGAKLSRQCPAAVTGETILMDLLDAVIDRAADILEKIGSEVDTASHDILEPEGGSDRPGGGQVGDDRQQRCPGRPRGPAEHPRAQRADKGRVQDEYGGDGHREEPSPRALRAWASACSSSAASCGLIWSTKWASAVRRSALVSSASLISDAVYPEREPVGS